MGRLFLLAFTVTLYVISATSAKETVLSAVLTPTSSPDKLNRQLRSYYDNRRPSPYYDRLEYARDYDRPRCGRCDDRYSDHSDEEDDYDRDDDRKHRPTSGKRYDNKKNDDDGFDRPKNSTEDDDKKDDKDRPSRRKHHRNRYDDRDRYRPDYYDRFLRDPYRERGYDRPYYDRRPYDRYPGGYEDPYSRNEYLGYRRPAYDRYDDGYGGYGPSAGRGPHESFRPWDETYRGQSGWDAAGRGYYFASGRPEAAPPTASWGRPEYSRPVESGWPSAGASAGGGYSGYQDPYRGTAYGGGQNAGYGQTTGYSQNAGYGQTGSRDLGAGYGQSVGYRQDPYASNSGYGSSGAGYGSSRAGYGSSGAGYGSSGAGYGASSGWHSVGERRPYRDESGVNQLDKRDQHGQQSEPSRYHATIGYRSDNRQPTYGQSNGQSNNYGQQSTYGQSTYGQPSTYGKSTYGQPNTYEKSTYEQPSTNGKSAYEQPSTYGKSTYGQPNTYGKSTYGQSNPAHGQTSTTPETSYLFQREDENVTLADETTITPS